MKLDKYTNEEIIDKMNSAQSMWQFCQSVGYTNKSSKTYSFVREHLKRRGIEVIYKTRKGIDTKKIPDEEVFCENSTYDRKDLKKRIITKNKLEYKCQECGIIDWQGKSITLQLDHINGINNDNRIENLRFLCPNCHTQTSTWGNRRQLLS